MVTYSKAAMEWAMTKKITGLAGSRKNGGAKGCGGRFTKTGHFICYEKLQARATLMALCFLSQRNDALRKGGHF